MKEVFGEEFVKRLPERTSVNYAHKLLKEKYNTRSKWYTLEGKQLQDISVKIIDKLDLNDEYEWALEELSNPKAKSFRGKYPENVKSLLRQFENTYSYRDYRYKLSGSADNKDEKPENDAPALSKTDFLTVVLSNKIEEHLVYGKRLYDLGINERETLSKNDFENAFKGGVSALSTAYLLNAVSPTANYHTIFSNIKYTYHMLEDLEDMEKKIPASDGVSPNSKHEGFDAMDSRKSIRRIMNNNLSNRYLDTRLELKEQDEISTYIDMTNHKAKQEALTRKGFFQPEI